MVFIGHEVSGWEDGQMVHLTQDSTCQGFNLTNPVNLISEKLHPKGMLIPRSRENLHHITANSEFSPLKVNVIALKLDIDQVIKELVTGDFKAWTQANHTVRVFLRRSQTIDTRDRSHDNHIVALQES